MSDSYDEVLNYWFSGKPLGKEQFNRWWRKAPEVDLMIRDRFAGLVDEVFHNLADEWAKVPKSCLAAILCLDQFPRNMYRGLSKSFEYDARALELVEQGLAAGHEKSLSELEKAFFILPLMHHENIHSQSKCIELYESFAAEAAEPFKNYLSSGAEFGRKHLTIIERFGRFPHRNEILRRESTVEEIEFLKQPGSSF